DALALLDPECLEGVRDLVRLLRELGIGEGLDVVVCGLPDDRGGVRVRAVGVPVDALVGLVDEAIGGIELRPGVLPRKRLADRGPVREVRRLLERRDVARNLRIALDHRDTPLSDWDGTPELGSARVYRAGRGGPVEV